ncbi:unnamed protein product [Prunus armeniaca]
MRQLQDSVLSKYAISRGYREIILEMDSKVLVEGTRGASNNGLWSVKPAAAIGARAVQLECWAVRPPRSLVGVLDFDSLPCPPVDVSAQ